MKPALISAVANPALLWMLVILGLFIWMLFRPRETAPLKILALIIVFAFEPFSVSVMAAENRAFPLKFDYYLYVIDKQLGISAFGVARMLAEWQRPILFAIYQSLSVAMIAWYGVNLKRRDGKPGKLLLAYLITFFTGPCLYLIVPACGPRHAFKSLFPMGDPNVAPALVSLNYWPNAIPSLHVATALLFVFFAGKNRLLRGIAWFYLAGTALATLAFEHYAIDLVVAVPFACFATLLAERQIRPALANLGIVLAWLLAIRFATPALSAYPLVLRVLALATIGFAVAGRSREGPVGDATVGAVSIQVPG
jgi:hypothetical protein